MTATRNAPSRTSRRFSTAEARQRGGILLRGVALWRFGILAALLLLVPLARGAAPSLSAILVAAVALLTGAALRDRWWVVRVQRAALEDALSRSCRMVRAVPATTVDGIRVKLTQADLLIRIRRRGVRSFELCFYGPWRALPKARLLRSVIAKQFTPALPRIRIRLRRVR